jgi:predicted nucleotide-binding protein (sugar kinase/HSP70/actin superfamily)
MFHRIVETRRISAIQKLYRDLPKIFKKEIEIYDKKNPLKVAICGEIYVVLEPALIVDIHRRLNELGVIVESTVTLRRFTDVFNNLNPFHKPHWEVARLLGKPYIQHRLGGETQENLGDITYYKKLGWDGIVHLYPFTCMPEIITRAIAPQVSKDNDMPFLSLVVDEHTGEAGFQTRLEAYIDLIKRKHEQSQKKKTPIGGIWVMEMVSRCQ